MQNLPAPHKDKLLALLQNEKLPADDQQRIKGTIAQYENWRKQLEAVRGTYEQRIARAVALVNKYKRYVEVDLIFDSGKDFLYRQKGQLKLDNTIIEEFLPIVVSVALADQLQDYNLSFGPTTCFSAIRFESSMTSTTPGAGIQV